jgi:hypothetical protein
MAHRLICERNNKTSENLIKKMARKRLGYQVEINTFYEHGRWWVKAENSNGISFFSVVDADGGETVYGLDLELVSEERF